MTTRVGAARSLVDYYVVRGRTQIQSQFQYRVATYFWLIGMLAEPIVYLVVWTTIADQQGGSVQGITAGEEQLERDRELEDRAHTRRPEGDHPERRHEHRPDQVGAPDREREDADLERSRGEHGVERDPEHRSDRKPEQDRDELPACESGKVVVKRVERPQQ